MVAPADMPKAVALAETLRAAAALAVALHGLDLSDPSTLLGAGKPAQGAFGEAQAHATRHDAVREAAFGLWQLTGDEQIARRFSGGGLVIEETVETYSPAPDDPTRRPRDVATFRGARYEPTGHPVTRLLTAAG